MDWKYLYTSLQGRINRKPYWLATLALIVISIVLQLLLLPMLGLLITFIISLPILFAAFALTLKRAHDRDRPDWYVIGFYVLVVIVQVAQLMSANPLEPGLIVTFGSVLALIWAVIMLVDLGFLRGTAGPNRYGPDPLTS